MTWLWPLGNPPPVCPDLKLLALPTGESSTGAIFDETFIEGDGCCERGCDGTVGENMAGPTFIKVPPPMLCLLIPTKFDLAYATNMPAVLGAFSPVMTPKSSPKTPSFFSSSIAPAAPTLPSIC